MLAFVLMGVIGAAYGALELPAECGNTYGCYSDCSGNKCKFLVTWKENENGGIRFTISLDLNGDTRLQWAAVGFSNDVHMGDDSVVECEMLSSTLATVYTSYNYAGRYNEVLRPSVRLGLGSITGAVRDGVLTCSFIRQRQVSGEDRYFDLSNDYYILFANGYMDATTKMQHSLNPKPLFSLEKVDFQTTDNVSNSVKRTLIKVHGSLMVLAWVFATSIGLVLARHYKHMWPNAKIGKQKIWFAFHRMLMISTCIICIAAFIIIFVEAEGWAELEGETTWKKIHPILGVIVTVLVIINPFMGFLRPAPGGRSRIVFNWCHWLVGSVAHFGAMFCMVIGVTISKARLPYYLMWILLAYCIYQILIELILEIYDCAFASSAKRYTRDGWLKDPKGSGFKKFMLTLHVLIITGFTVTVIVLIAIK